MSSKIYSKPFAEVYEAAVKAIETSGFTITDRRANRIEASSPSSIRSFGERIVVSLSASEDGTKVQVSSSPLYQMIDWGKSDENVITILSNIDKQLKVKKWKGT